MKRLELAIESIILASRWLLVVFYIGLALALAVYALSFGKKDPSRQTGMGGRTNHKPSQQELYKH